MWGLEKNFKFSRGCDQVGCDQVQLLSWRMEGSAEQEPPGLEQSKHVEVRGRGLDSIGSKLSSRDDRALREIGIR